MTGNVDTACIFQSVVYCQNWLEVEKSKLTYLLKFMAMDAQIRF